MAREGRTFRIFVSSTFGDLKEERNALHKHVFSKLRDLCMQHGPRFQAMRLRTSEQAEAGMIVRATKGDRNELFGRLLELNRRTNVAKAGLDSDGDVALLYEVPQVFPGLLEKAKAQMAPLLRTIARM